MSITRDVVIDLLPLYAAGEASADTRALVEDYMRQDPSLGRLLRALQATEAAPASMEPSAHLEREAVTRTRAMIRRRTWTMAFAIFLTLLPLSIAFDSSGVKFFMLRDQPASALLWVVAAVLWFMYARWTRALGAAIPRG